MKIVKAKLVTAAQPPALAKADDKLKKAVLAWVRDYKKMNDWPWEAGLLGVLDEGDIDLGKLSSVMKQVGL